MKRILPCVVGLIVLMVVSLPHPSARAGTNLFTGAGAISIWSTGPVSDFLGAKDVLVQDIDDNGKTEIISCSLGHVYLLRYHAADYRSIWFSEEVECLNIATADQDGDGVFDIYVGAGTGWVWLYAGDTHDLLGGFPVPTTYSLPIGDIAVGNVDSDPGLEIVVVRSDGTWVFNAATFALEWGPVWPGGSRVAIGNLDGDVANEIVVNGANGHVLSAVTRTIEWNFGQSFGVDLALGDVDGDNRDEIVTISDTTVTVLEGDSHATLWADDSRQLNASLVVADVTNDDVSEVIVGNSGSPGAVTGFNGDDGRVLWSIASPRNGVFGVAVGDANADGVAEILWAAESAFSGHAVLVVGSWVTETVLWTSLNLDGWFGVAAADLDGNGASEIVTTSWKSEDGDGGGVIQVFSGTTQALLWTAPTSAPIWSVAVGQVDPDAPLEIVLSTGAGLATYDGLSHMPEWSSAAIDGQPIVSLAVANLDADPVDEVVVGLESKQLLVLNGASDEVLWQSEILDGNIMDVVTGDLDGNSTPEIAVLTNAGVTVFEAGSWAQRMHQSLSNGKQLLIANHDLTGPGELIVQAIGADFHGTLTAWEGSAFAVRWSRELGNMTAFDLAAADVDSDGVQELIFAGIADAFDLSYQDGFFGIASAGFPGFWEDARYSGAEAFYRLATADVDSDGRAEILKGGFHRVQLDDVLTYTLYPTYIPVLVKQ